MISRYEVFYKVRDNRKAMFFGGNVANVRIRQIELISESLSKHLTCKVYVKPMSMT